MVDVIEPRHDGAPVAGPQMLGVCDAIILMMMIDILNIRILYRIDVVFFVLRFSISKFVGAKKLIIVRIIRMIRSTILYHIMCLMSISYHPYGTI